MTQIHDDVLEQAGRWRDEGRKVALATVVSTWGSSPRPVGSQLAVDETGNMVGSVSGGCIEGAVVLEPTDTRRIGAQRGGDACGQATRRGVQIFQHAAASPVEVGAVFEDHEHERDAEEREPANR